MTGQKSITLPIKDRMKSKLDYRRSSGNFRSVENYVGIDFCSNDYLGLARHPFTAASHKVGSTGSRLISGNSPEISDLEASLSTFFGFERALLFGSGYFANFGLLSCLATRQDVIISDEYIHASLIDGIRITKAARFKFGHNDLGDLERKLMKNSATCRGQIFVVVESLYSMDGDSAPLKEIAKLCKQYGAALIVDEAHSVGVYGPSGRGSVVQQWLADNVFAVVYTFGKAFGLHGAAICSSKPVIDYLTNFCRPFIYTTAPSPHTALQIRAALERIMLADNERRKLERNIAFFREQIGQRNIGDMSLLPSTSPIQGLLVNGNENAKLMAQMLRGEGCAVKAILSPTVPKGLERIRICLHSFNTKDEIKHLVQSISSQKNRVAA